MKILIVEDDELNAYALTTVLMNQKYAIEVATDGEVAWDLIQTYDYDLILLDIVLPKLDGVSLCRQIRSKGVQVPILLLTGRDSSHDKAIGLDAGADDYVVKPFDEEELVARVRALLRRGAVTNLPVLEWGSLRLDPTSCEVMYAGNMLSLTPKEYALLELFLRNSRRVFSCGMILEHLWSYEDTPGEEAVRTHIKGLRQKLKAVGAPSDLIETVYGIGYRLKPREEEGGKQEEKSERRLPTLVRVASPTGEDSLTLRYPIRTSGAGEQGDLEHSKSSTVTNLKFQQQQVQVAVAGIWERFQGRVDEQVRVLEQATEVLKQKVVNDELLLQAVQEAHTLAGSLGTFGLATGSKLARNIELVLKSGETLSAAEVVNLESWVKLLRQEIEIKNSLASSVSPNGEELPLILLVDSDRTLTEELTKASVNWGLKVIIATSLHTARNQYYREHPNVVLFNPSISPHQQESWKFLAEISQSQPHIPVLVFTEQTDFTNRLQVAHNGRHTFLQKPMPIAEVLEAVIQVLQNAHPTEAKILVVDDDPQVQVLL